MNLSKLETEHFYEIAKIIDNDYIGSKNILSVEKKSTDDVVTYYLIDTNKCDNASLIRIYVDDNKQITHITRLGSDVDTWTDVQKATLTRVISYLVDIEVENCVTNFNQKKESIFELENHNLKPYYELIRRLTAQLKLSSADFNRNFKFYTRNPTQDHIIFEIVNQECSNSCPDARVKRCIDHFMKYEDATKLIDELHENNIPSATITQGGISMSISRNEIQKLKHIFDKFDAHISMGSTSAIDKIMFQ